MNSGGSGQTSSTTNLTSTSQPPQTSVRQEDKNRKLLEDLNRTRQMMLKNSGSRVHSSENVGLGGSGLSKDFVTMNGVDMQTSITFLPTNSSYGNSILPIIPRISPD